MNEKYCGAEKKIEMKILALEIFELSFRLGFLFFIQSFFREMIIQNHRYYEIHLQII